MKKIILVRHAKSDWPENTEDFDRPLAVSGVRDAHKMGVFLKNNALEIDKMITSPAKRALSTCEIFNDYFNVDCAKNLKLYGASEDDFLSVLQDLDDSIHTVAVFSHNNGISNFANYIAEGVFHFPTCGVAGFDVNCEKWAEFDGADKQKTFFYEPKKI